MKTILFIILLAAPFIGFTQMEISTTNSSIEIVDAKKNTTNTTGKIKATKNAKHIKVYYKRSSDIISTKAYRKSLNVKVSTKRLMC
jgi:hypothetical protein